ncbi:diaminopimelate decarboxylase [Sphingosinicella microcystinivorans]|uniref:Diaminopimelate decarboxylase n=1 Tax=Sphingosinicella microcystinivorans TaxID=335406 RepID=A0AAD1D5B5_SPHMI|nr:diaminopimelate decarboxylase [Sphingosinicella microcystinivorans]RKS90936.1 diaminopimelate decarboxylase [Sphingosinicella microcystinivorans]BBE33855.1 diaminopimelate decarboxylase [Sphingosinicella microcystinivorans]
MDHFQHRDGRLMAEDVDVAALADTVGTPFYCYSSATIERHFTVFRDAVAGAGNGPPLVAYAVKANSNQAVIATLARIGAGADVVSLGEMKRALAAGVPAERIVFSGVGKTADEMEAAIHAGVFQINLESLPEAEMLSAVAARMGRTVPVAFRVNPDVDAGTHAKISTGKAENKFGIPIDTTQEAFALAAALPGIEPVGVALHIGSQLTDLAPLEKAFTRLGALIAELRAAGHTVSRADLGGGLGVPYMAHTPGPPLPEAYGAMVARVTAEWDVRLTFEPGRVIVGNAGVLVSRVIRVKTGATTDFVIIDAAMNDLLRPSLYDAWHDIDSVMQTDARMTATVVGPVCETGDTFAEGREIPAVEAGDLVVFRTAGAYGAAMASTYNSRLLTPEVLVKGDKWALVRPRSTIEDLIAQDRVPNWVG